MIVYVVTEGSYSDYRICQIFSTEEKANNYIKWRCEDMRKPMDYNSKEDNERKKSWTDESIIELLDLHISDFTVDGDFIE